jgi:hypothetical protein
MIKQICLYCKSLIGFIPEEDDPSEKISHGICLSCTPRIFAGTGASFSNFLDRFEVPLFVIGPDTCLVDANALGKKLVGKELAQIQGRSGGEVFECMYAELPGGCGETIHCKSCTVRKAVTETAATGHARFKIPAYMDLGDLINNKSVHFLISTEKVGEMVLLRIDETGQDPSKASEKSPTGWLGSGDGRQSTNVVEGGVKQTPMESPLPLSCSPGLRYSRPERSV